MTYQTHVNIIHFVYGKKSGKSGLKFGNGPKCGSPIRKLCETLQCLFTDSSLENS